MLNQHIKHKGYYLSVISILALGLISISLSGSNRQIQIGVAALTTLGYVSWGILHHFINHDLNFKIVIEYMLIGCLGLGLILFLLKGGMGI